MKWTFFAGAGILSAYWLYSFGAPAVAIASGIAGAGIVNLLSLRRRA
ncbi:MAG: hypothetical protein ABIZ80_19035 [Bryobacteraceae bacterium]